MPLVKKKKNGSAARRTIRCYLCAREHEVSTKTMSTNCPHCNRPLIVEDITVKSYVPVIDLQTCGNIKITRRGRVAAKNIQAGDSIKCEGAMEGAVEAVRAIALGPKSSWKGSFLHCPTLRIDAGAQLNGPVTVPGK